MQRFRGQGVIIIVPSQERSLLIHLFQEKEILSLTLLVPLIPWERLVPLVILPADSADQAKTAKVLRCVLHMRCNCRTILKGIDTVLIEGASALIMSTN